MTETQQTDPKYACYMFEAKSIQQYLFSTNRLREIVGGSEMIEKITGSDGLLDKLVTELGIEEKLEFSRKGGGAFYVFSDPETILQLQQAWSLLFQIEIPNMTFNHASAQANTNFAAFENAQAKLLASRNRISPRLPQATPFTLRFNRTGEPVEKKNKAKGEIESIDIATATKLKYAQGKALIKRFDKASEHEHWPVYLTPEPNQEPKNFPFKDDSRAIALIHADGNGFGQLLMTLKEQVKSNPENFIKIFSDFSQAISTATENAAQTAVDTVLAENKDKENQLYPARQIVLGGDDLTILVRADLAIAFTNEFLNAFEVESKKQLTKLKEEHTEIKGIPTKLTACAGITFAKASHPFHMMHDLSEALCGAAKEKSKSNIANDGTVPSSLVFHRITTSLVDGYASIVANELTAGDQQLTLGAYATKPNNTLPNLESLFALLKLFDNQENSTNALREIQSLLKNDKDEAETRYKRWLEILEKIPESTMKNDYLELMGSLITTTRNEANGKTNSQKSEEFSAIKTWPINDLLTLKAVKAIPLSQQIPSEENPNV